MLLTWFNASESKKLGASLAQYFLERVPKQLQKSDKSFSKKVDEVLAHMDREIVQFRQQHRLNFYKKAQLANEFKWALLDGGVAADYAEQITKWLTHRLG